ncbi:MAG: ligase-associated DNA damage response endonuclease PdeM [Proteobacteria bacterium]|nr:ligase-associated DNA damage response endonuclease PdeM [Pseudomonadota bacterium]
MVPVSFARFTHAGHDLALVDGQALFWPAQDALVVADLHLEKASWYAERGQMLPPYDSRATLERLGAALAASGARRLVCLGDNFHDNAGPARLEPGAGELLAAICVRHEVLWITGNHDDAPQGLGGTVQAEGELGGIALRHQALPGACEAELSGHFHPKLAVMARGRRIVRPCAVAGGQRLILPAFGALTGGLWAHDAAIGAALAPARGLRAIVAAGQRAVEYPLEMAINR